MSNYLREVLGAEKTFLNPNQPQGLVADIGPDIPGGEGANEGFWREQLRDRLGQFAKMFGIVLFDMEIEGIGRVTGHGELIKIVRPQVGVVRIKNHPILPDGDYEVPGDNLEAIDALIPDADYERVTGKDLPKSEAPELKDSITGDEALKTIRSYVTSSLKEEGRFPVIRSDADIEKVVSEQYKSLFPQIQKENPELLKLTTYNLTITNADLFWTVLSSQFATDLMTMYTSPDQLNPLQRLVNQLYAEKFLGLKRDGLISFYRNNIRAEDTEVDAASGYASLDRYMAFDYNVALGKNEGGPNTGRYEIKAKPDEVNGLLGFSRIGDEIGVVISPEVTSIPGRVTRLGDLEIPDVDSAPWLDLKNIEWDRSFGSSPFRQHKPLGQFDYYGLDKDPFGGGNTWASFYEAHGLEKGAIPQKYDELHGEGAWARDWEDFNPKASYFKALFTEYKDENETTKWGLKGDALWNIGIEETDLSNPKANDGFEKNIKILSTMQELMGKPFFVSRGHSKDDPRVVEAEQSGVEVPGGDVEFFDDSEKPKGPGLTVNGRSQLREIKTRLGGEIFDTTAIKLIEQYSGSDDDVKKLDAALSKKGIYRKRDLSTNAYVDAVRSAISDYKKIDPNLNIKREAKKAEYGSLNGTGLGVIGYLQTGTLTRFDNFDFSYASDKDKLSAAREEIIKNGFVNPITILYNPDRDDFSLENPEDSLKILATREIKDPDIKIRAIPTVVKVSAESDSFDKDTELNPVFFYELSQPSAWVADIQVKPEEYYDLSGIDSLPVPSRTDAEKEAIDFYQRGTYLTLKKYLADPSSAGDDAEKLGKIVDTLNKLGNSEKLPANTELFRGFRLSADSDLYKYYSSLKSGDVLADPNRFGSTSLDPIVAEDFATLGGKKDDYTGSVVLEISTEEGATGVVFGDNEDTYASGLEVVLASEKEVLLPFAAELKINKIFKDSDGILRIQAKYGKKVELESKSDTADQDSIDFSSFEKVSGPLGSNPGGVYKDPKTGEQYYVKIQDEDRGNNERLASAIYKEAGLGSLEVKDGTLDGNPVTYTEWRENLIPLFGSQSDKLRFTERQDALDTARDGYLIDAWIANWDIVGEGLDNISADKDGNPVRLDAGGALLYRARGSKKGDSFGNEVVELDTFRDPSNTAERMYGSMYLFPRAERESYEKLKAITPERIDQLVDQYISNSSDNQELKNKLKARRQFILDKYEGSTFLTGPTSKLYGSKTTQNISKEDKKAVRSYTDAGYRYINRYLREPENPNYQRYKDDADELNNIINANTLTEDTTLLRVTRNFDEDYQQGDIIEDAGIQSTTKVGRSAIHSTVMDKLYPDDPEAAEFVGYTTYTIKAPAGTPALDATEISQFRSEGEVLLPAGTKFKVVSYERKPVSEFGGSYRNITVEVVSGEESEKIDTNEPFDGAEWVEEEQPISTAKVLDSLVKDGIVDLDAVPDSTILSKFTVDDIPEDQRRSLSTYSGSDYQVINNLLRFGPESAYTPTENINKLVKNLDDLIESKGTVESDSVVFRGMIETERYEDSDVLMSEMLDGLKPGDVISDPAFLSTSSDKNVALRKFGPGNMTDEDSKLDASNPVYQSSSFWVIKVPEGSKAFATPEKGFGYASVEKEVILPRNTQLRIDGIKKVAQEEEGGENGEFNYYIEASVVPVSKNADWDPLTGLETSTEKKERIEPGELPKDLPKSSWGTDFSQGWPDSEIELIEKNGKKLPRGWDYKPIKDDEKDEVPSTIADKFFTNEKAANELTRMYYKDLASRNELEFYQSEDGLIVTFEGPEGTNLPQEKKNRFLQDASELYAANKDIVDGELMIRFNPEIAARKGGTVAWAADKKRTIGNLLGKYPTSVGRKNPNKLGEFSGVKMIATETLEKTTLSHEFGHILRYSNVEETYVEKTTKKKRKRGYQVTYENVIGWALETKSISGTRGDSLIDAQKRRGRIHMTEYSKKNADEWYAELFNSWIAGGGSFNYREDLSASDIVWLNNFAKDQEWKMPK